MISTSALLGRIAPRMVLLAFAFLFAACSGNPDAGQAQACHNGISKAYAELKQAESEGLGGAVDITKAASLLSAAKVQEQFEKYPNCIDKVKRARHYIRQAQQKG